MAAISIVSPDDLEAKELLFDAFFQKRNWAPALVLAEQLADARPDDARLQKIVVATLSNMKRYNDAIQKAFQYREGHGEDLTILDALKVAHFYTGKIDAAISYGQRALDLRDQMSCALPRTMTIKEPEGVSSGHNVISFSLWGATQFYSYSAMINSGLELPILCRCRRASTLHRLPARQRRRVARLQGRIPGVGLFQRFLVMNDPTVGRFLVRDCDARLSAIEAGLIAEWIDSGLPFHVARDHVLHNELLMGGMWAGRTDCGIDIVSLMRRYFTAGPNAKYGHDQRMLGMMLWPIIRNHCLVHDKYYVHAEIP